MATVPVLCEGKSSSHDNKTWLEKVKNIVQLNKKPPTICEDQPPPVIKQITLSWYNFLEREERHKKTVNYLSSADDKGGEFDALTDNTAPGSTLSTRIANPSIGKG